MLARLGRDLPQFVRHPVGDEEALRRVSYNLEHRAERLVASVESLVFKSPRSPYLKLLRHAGCELGDFKRLVHDEGVEGALGALARQGVYATFDEFKGRTEAVRGSLRVQFHQDEFDNPVVPPHAVMYSGGSGGRPSRIRYSLQAVEEWAISNAAAEQALGLFDVTRAHWWPLPIAAFLTCAALGQDDLWWFYPVYPLPKRARLLAAYVRLLCRLGGFPFPAPQHRDLDASDAVATWIADRLATGRQVKFRATPSAAARVAVAALDRGRSLDGLTLYLVGEPVTPWRRQQIEATGARVMVLYGAVELFMMSNSCATPTSADDVHIMLDLYAMTQRERPAVPGGPLIDATLVTSLSPVTAKVALNLEIGDYARLETRDCGCLLGKLGMRTHLSEIRSFEKLTSEGVTFARFNLQRILEEAMPRRFGGSGLDYQLAELEGDDGSTRFVLRVSPIIGEIDEAVVSAAFLEELGGNGPVDRHHAEMLRRVGAVLVRREAPVATTAGKVLPLDLLRSTRSADPATGR